jgi:hypothetical protein
VLTEKVELRAISPTKCNVTGGEEMHVVGSPFIKGPSLKVMFRTEHGVIDIKYAEGRLERYSESVLFFKVPPYPNYPSLLLMKSGDLMDNGDGSLAFEAFVSVTNDSRHFSNQLKLIYYHKAR